MSSKTDAILVINTKTPDANAVLDIVDALLSDKVEVNDVDVQAGTIRICATHNQLELVKCIEGVDYVRPVMHFHASDGVLSSTCDESAD